MFQFLVKRLVGSAAVLVATSVLVFFLTYLAPGDPAVMIVRSRIGRLPTEQEAAVVRSEYGLDKSPWQQYFTWASHAIGGDFGYSFRTGKPAIAEIGSRLAPTLLLAGATTLFSAIVGIPSGLISAQKRNSWWDNFSRTLSLLSVSIPDFWLAFLLILVFSIYLGWLPTYGMRGAEYLILPVLSLGLANAARLERLTRSTLLQVQHENYLQTARAKGLSEGAVWIRHALPNIAVPLLTVVANQFSHIVAGSVIVETLFSWPGIGNYYIISIKFRDIPVIQAMVLLFAFVMVVVNAIADIAYALIDPRIRLE
ncbi:ABC transporter permease [Planktothrix sp. FACHB-1355]|uniref:ABC transporter permease n=1 Tax=Aerosakkonema funiforme FACHB-1375 TaxID=2949571 RepID=A0A926ZHC7_9CYAN|nr:MULTISPECIES: ABC transporter permease [Oscillatoriales]MBD2182484.1 ABC transporter permease [Aerosakkonema funiforme FACHB-1375]MBD3562049.1 ABC transporter permease [Planktothrix sp. FACHB-1355]